MTDAEPRSSAAGPRRRRSGTPIRQAAAPLSESGAGALATVRHRGRAVRQAWVESLGPGERSTVWAWATFTATFAATRALTHWIRAGHGPAGGGITLGGRHFHHYNIGIAVLEAVGTVALRGTERARHHPVVATSYGAGSALIVDELALLLDLEDVYWAREGRTSVDAAVVVIGLGGVATAGFEFWPRAHRALRGHAVNPDGARRAAASR